MYDNTLTKRLTENLTKKRKNNQNINIYVRGAHSSWHFIDSKQYDNDTNKIINVLVLLIVRIDEKYRNQGLFKQGWSTVRDLFVAQTYWKKLQVQSVKNLHLLEFLQKQPGATTATVAGCNAVTFLE